MYILHNVCTYKQTIFLLYRLYRLQITRPLFNLDKDIKEYIVSRLD